MEAQLTRSKTVVVAYLAAVAMAALLYGWYQSRWLYAVRTGIEQAMAQVEQTTARGIWILGAPQRTLGYWQSGAERLATLEQRLAQVVVDTARMKELQERNAALEQALNIEPVSEASLIMGRVIVTADEALLAAGTEAGVTPGMVVVDQNGVYLGQIKVSGGYVAALQRPQDREAVVPVRVLGTASSGVIRGEGGRARLEGVLQAEALGEGDILVTSGAGGQIPEGIVVGQVTKVEAKPADVTKGAEVVLLGAYDGFGFGLRGSEEEL